jgi:anti-sigma regulatory factor (Ser/Thr protein kinase)
VTASQAGRALLWDEAAPLLTLAARTGVMDDATLIVSELIANAIQASATRIRLDVDLHRDRLILSVLDDGAGWPTPRDATVGATSGRGLKIVDALSQQWGVTPGPVSKQVWAMLPVALGATTTALICNT